MGPETKRRTIEPIGICYFVAPRTTGQEVRFPVRPVTTRTEKKHAFPRQKRSWFNHLFRGIERLALLAALLLFLFSDHLMVWFGPAPSPALIPQPPYYQGQTIKGPDTKGQVHTWVYAKGVGWVDP